MSIPISVSPKASKDSLNSQKESSDLSIEPHQINTETVSFDGGVIIAGCSDDEDEEVYDDELDENEVLVDDDDDDEDEIYNELYNGSTGGASEIGVVVGADDLDENSGSLKCVNNSEHAGELGVLMNNDDLFASCNGMVGVDDEVDEDAASHSTEITLLGAQSLQNSFEKPPGASPSLLKKFSKISKLPKKISANTSSNSNEKKISKLTVNKSLAFGPTDGISIGNNKYFKKFKFKRGNKNEERKQVNEHCILYVL